MNGMKETRKVMLKKYKNLQTHKIQHTIQLTSHSDTYRKLHSLPYIPSSILMLLLLIIPLPPQQT